MLQTQITVPGLLDAVSKSNLIDSPGLRENNHQLVRGLVSGQARTPEQIAAAVRRRPIGAVIADICRDLGILPSHPLWPELSKAVVRHGGSLVTLLKDILTQATHGFAQHWAAAWPLPAPFPPCPSHAGADPP